MASGSRSGSYQVAAKRSASRDHAARLIALIVWTATPWSAHTAASSSKSARYRGFRAMVKL
jgi:isoleucyl-tRNA synthetase